MVILEFAQTADMDSISLEIRENLDQISGYTVIKFRLAVCKLLPRLVKLCIDRRPNPLVHCIYLILPYDDVDIFFNHAGSAHRSDAL